MRRRNFIAVATTAYTTVLAGCITGGDENGESDDNGQLQTNGETGGDDATPEPEGYVHAAAQEGQGYYVVIESVGANVPFVVYIEYADVTWTSVENEPGEYDNVEIELPERIMRAPEDVTAEVHTLDGDVLDSLRFEYHAVPGGPQLDAATAEDIFRDAAPRLGGSRRRPWGNLHAWGRPDDGRVTDVDSHPDGWEPVIFWEAEATVGTSDAEGLEIRISSINLRLFREMLVNQDEYEVRSATAEVWFHHDDRSSEHIASTTMTMEEAQQVNWDNEIQSDRFIRSRMRNLVDDHQYDATVWDG